MTISRASLEGIPTCYATCSIGCKPHHTLPHKLKAISAAGFHAIELSFPDLLSFAKKCCKKDVEADDYEDLCIAAREVKAVCEGLGLKVFMLQPFGNFEGWPEGSDERKDAFARADGWIKIMQACGTELLQVGSTDSPDIITSRERAVSDLRELADLLAAHNMRLAYENWCWSTHAPTWSDVWEIVRDVDRPNVGLCLDTFQTAGSEWADPTTKTGLMDGDAAALEAVFQQSLERLSQTVPQDKIYILQISDAYKPEKPIGPEVDPGSGLRPRGRWSHDYRPIPFAGGYLPVVLVTEAILRTGFRGVFSIEIFDGGPDGSGKEYENMGEFALEAMKAHVKLLDTCADAP